MEKDFTPYDRALKLKALGFNEPCISFYSKGGKHNYDVQSPCTNIGSWSDQEHYCSAPTFSQAFRWFREKCELYSWVELHNGYIDDSYYKKLPITWTIMESESGKQYYERDTDHNYLYHTHEEAELACLDKLLEIVEQKQKEDGK